MAKNKKVEKKKEELEIVIDDNNTEVEKKEEIVVEDNIDVETTNEVLITKEETPQKQPIKMVKIKLKEDHRCHVGGEWYVFEEGKQYNVPQSVKDILATVDLLLPL